MKQMLFPVLAVALIWPYTPARAADDEFAKVEIKVHKVAGNVYMLEGEGGNIGVSVGPDGIVIVDDEFAPLAPKIKAALRGIVDKPVRFVLNTHYHGDHTGGNVVFGESAAIIAHENVRNRLASGSRARNGRERPPAPKVALETTEVAIDERRHVGADGRGRPPLVLPILRQDRRGRRHRQARS